MNRYKIFGVLLILMGMLAFPSYLFALEVSVESKSVQPGSTADLQVYVEDAAEIGNLAFDIEYDETQLDLLGAVLGKMLEGALFAMNPEAFPSTAGLFRFNAVVAEGFSGQGDLLKLTFSVADTASGSLPVTLERVKAANIELEDVITVKRDGGLFVETVVADGGGIRAIPQTFQLLSNYPNPFNPGTYIPYQLAEAADVVICIYNVEGQLVRTMELGWKAAGYYLSPGRAAYWDGRNEADKEVASGVYLCRLRAGRFTAARKLVMIK